MNFILLRTLQQSELGWFGEVRRQGRETSRQRALNFDATEVERMFPLAMGGDVIPVLLHRRNDARELAAQPQALRRQKKNWRLTGDKVDDLRFGEAAPGDLVVMALKVEEAGATGAFEVVPAADSRVGRLLAHPQAGGLASRGLLAVPALDAPGLAAALGELDPELFRPYLPPPTDPKGPNLLQNGATSVDGELIVPPSPGRMMQVIGNLGHSLQVAAADIIDNAITAGASHIDVYFQRPVRREPTELFLGKLSFPGGYIAFTDDGRGMDRATLVEAMKFGSQRDYGARDLGRFGIGLKAASFSQARCLTVASRTASSDITVLRWDRDHVEATGRWEVLQPQLNEAEREVLLEPLAERAGTVVLWTKLRPRVATERRGKRVDGPDGGYGRAMEDLVLHLGMVFHRFLTGTTRSQRRVAISMNCNDIPAWDPFLREHGDTQQSTAFSELVPCPGTDRQYPVTLEAWILPHTKMLSPAEKERAGQYGRWNELQGFYIYRADRIIQAGGWCDLWTPEEHKKLLRVALDFDPELDAAFDVHAAKMSVTLPVPLAERLDKKLQDARRDADTRFRKEGKEEKPAPVKVVGGGSSPPMSAVPAPAAPSAKPADPAPASPDTRPSPVISPRPPPAHPAPVPAPLPVAPSPVTPVLTTPVSVAPLPVAPLQTPPAPVAPTPVVSEPKPLPDELQIKEHLDEDLWRIHNPMFGPPHVLGNAGHPGMRPLLDAIKNNPTAKEALARLLAATEEGVSLSGGDTSAFRRHLRSRLKGAP